MEIGLIDVDGHTFEQKRFPNLALMKISAWHKARGDHVEWWNGLKYYDRVYQAKVFDETYTKDNEFVVQAGEIIKGGTGYGLEDTLPDEIEHIYPDYSLYGTGIAYGFLTRGCPRHCKFCIVGDKEGLVSRKVADLSEFWRGQKQIEILDPNLLACIPDRMELLDQLIQSGAEVNFNQGLDVRFCNKEIAEKLNQIKLKSLHFAWDNYEHQTESKLGEVRQYLNYDFRKLIVYVLTNFNTTHEQDLERIYRLRDMGYAPYVMIYDKPHAPRKTRLLQRWCNNRRIFNVCEKFDDYDPRMG